MTTPKNKVEGWEEEFDGMWQSTSAWNLAPHENASVKSFIHNLLTIANKEKEEAVKRVDMEIYALENTLEKSKELSVAVGHKRVYERIKLISEYKGKLEAWKEMKEILTPTDTTISSNE